MDWESTGGMISRWTPQVERRIEELNEVLCQHKARMKTLARTYSPVIERIEALEDRPPASTRQLLKILVGRIETLETAAHEHWGDDGIESIAPYEPPRERKPSPEERIVAAMGREGAKKVTIVVEDN